MTARRPDQASVTGHARFFGQPAQLVDVPRGERERRAHWDLVLARADLQASLLTLQFFPGVTPAEVAILRRAYDELMDVWPDQGFPPADPGEGKGTQ